MRQRIVKCSGCGALNRTPSYPALTPAGCGFVAVLTADASYRDDFSGRRILEANPGAGRRVQSGAQPDEARNRLTRRPATHHHASDSRARPGVSSGASANIASRRISRVYLALICGQFSEDTIPLTIRPTKSAASAPVSNCGKRRQRICRHLSPSAECFYHTDALLLG